MMLAILLVSLLAISAVSAADNTTSDVVSVEKVNDEFVSIANEDINETTILISNSMSIEDNSEIDVSKENKLSASAATFTDLANDIANAGDELNLTKDYVYSSVDSNYIVGIDIDKKIGIAIDRYNLYKTVYDLNDKVYEYLLYELGISDLESKEEQIDAISHLLNGNICFPFQITALFIKDNYLIWCVSTNKFGF